MALICIAGMHRSGTSLVARLLQEVGVNLGDPSRLMPPMPDNPDGFFEHLDFVQINKKLLELLGGDWDVPPDLPAGWHEAAILESQADAARELLRRTFKEGEIGAWKDPRNSLLLPFWLDKAPDLKVIVCLRGPWGVARSLMRRSVSSARLGLSLWEHYYRSLAAALPENRFIVTHHDALRVNPLAEMNRLLRFIGLPAPTDLAGTVGRVVRRAEPGALLNEAQELTSRGEFALLEVYDAFRVHAGPVYLETDEAQTPPAPPAGGLAALSSRRRLTAVSDVHPVLRQQLQTQARQAEQAQRWLDALVAAKREAVARLNWTDAITLDFRPNGNAWQYTLYGWGAPQDRGCWTDGASAALLLPAPTRFGISKLCITLRPVGTSQQRVVLRCNGHELGAIQLALETEQTLEWNLSPEVLSPGRPAVLEMLLPNALEPGIPHAGQERRRLAVQVGYVVIRQEIQQDVSSQQSGASLYRQPEFAVDVGWYARRYPMAVLSVQAGQYSNLTEFHKKAGETLFNSPSPLFCSAFYAERSDYVGRAPGWGLVEDYLRYGAQRGISPHWLYDEKFVQQQDPRLVGVIAVGGLTGSFVYYLRQGYRSGLRPHPLYCAGLLAKMHPEADVKSLFVDYVDEMHTKGVAASCLFDEGFYLGHYPEVKGNIGRGLRYASALQHYCEQGLAKGWLPIPDLDVDYYLRSCAKLRRIEEMSDCNPVQHFLWQGIRLGINPNRFFQSDYYLERNPAVVDEIRKYGFIGPFEHFLSVGLKQGLRAAPPLVSMAVDDDQAKSLFEKRARLETHQVVQGGGKLVLDQPQRPIISAVVPVHDNFNYTVWLLKQFCNYQRSSEKTVSLEVIVVDDGSTDQTKELQSWVSGIKIVRTEQAHGYPSACNAGAQVAVGEHLVFLNNDIELVAGSFEAVARVLSDPTVGAVGGKIIKLNGVLQEAGGLVFRDGSAAGYGRGEDPLAARFNVGRDVDYCSGCFLGVRRSTFEQLGGFDEQFSPGYYEETDLCARIWQAGLRVRFDPEISIYHYEYGSFSKGRPEMISEARMLTKKDLFAERNFRYLEKLPSRHIEKIDGLAFWRGQHQPHAVLLMDGFPENHPYSGVGRLLSVVDVLLTAGWWVTVMALAEKSLPNTLRNQRGLEYLLEKDIKGGLCGYLSRAGESVDLFWIYQTHNFSRAGQTVCDWRSEQHHARSVPRVVFDAGAITTVERVLVEELSRHGNLDCKNLPIDDQQVMDELWGSQQGDALIVGNVNDKISAQRVSPLPVFVLGSRRVVQNNVPGWAGRTGLLFCSDVQHEGDANHDALVWFCNRVWPRIRRVLPGCTLQIAGHWRDGVLPPVSVTAEEGIHWVGALVEPAPVFDTARVFVAPNRIASGIPYQVEQAMACGLPATVTPILAMQLEPEQPDQALGVWPAADFSEAAFAEAVVRLYRDETLWVTTQRAGWSAVERFSNPQVFAETVAKIVERP